MGTSIFANNNFLKNFSAKPNLYSLKTEAFRKEHENKLFDICCCKCINFSNCNCVNKVPILERPFLLDQRGPRKMVIGTIDIPATKKLQKNYERKIVDQERVSRARTIASESNTVDIDFSDTESESDSVNGDETNIISSSTLRNNQSLTAPTQNRICFPNVARACDRMGISDRAAAIIVSSTLQDLGIVSPNHSSLMVDRSKIRRARKVARTEIQSSQLSQP